MKIITNNIKIITNIIQNIIKKELPRPLGRWKIEECNTKINNKIDLSNEDHCGPCGKYALEKITALKSKDALSNNKLDNKYKIISTFQDFKRQ